MHISFFLLLFFTFLTIYHGSGEAHIREILKTCVCLSKGCWENMKGSAQKKLKIEGEKKKQKSYR